MSKDMPIRLDEGSPPPEPYTWISVKEVLPFQYDWVLVGDKDEGTAIARHWEGDGWVFLTPTGQAIGEGWGCRCGDMLFNMHRDEITHWMVMPTVPYDLVAPVLAKTTHNKETHD